MMSEEELAEELKYISNTIKSSWEFVHYTWLIQDVSRAFTHQFVRSRTGSFAQQSMRVTDQGSYEYIPTARNYKCEVASIIIDNHTEYTQKCYNELIAAGQPPEDARGVLPTNISTNIVASFNLRSFADLVQKRSGGRTQNEYRDVVDWMAQCVLNVHPWSKDFLYPEGRDYFKEIEDFADREFADDIMKKGELLKIVDKMRGQ
jgi:thymidylate synthase (FAD)